MCVCLPGRDQRTDEESANEAPPCDLNATMTIIDHAPARPRARSRRWALYGAEVLSGVGDGVFWVALLIELAGRPRFGLLLLLAVLARLGPRALLSVAAGGLVDRTRLRRLIVTIDVVRGLLMLAVATIEPLGRSPSWLLLCVVASYVIGVPTRPALTVALVRVTDENRLASANATMSMLRQLMTFVGPLVGVAIAATSTSVAFAINGASFMGAAALVAVVPGLDRAHADEHPRSRRPGRRVGAFPGFAARDSVLRGRTGLGSMFVLVASMYFIRGFEMVVHVLVVRDVLRAEPGAIGYLSGAIGLGAVLAMPVAARLANAPPDRVMQLAVILTAAPMAALVATDGVATAAVVLVFVGVGMVAFEVVSVVTIQRSIPATELGRVFGALSSASNTGKLLGAVTAPAMVAAIGTSGALLAAAAGLVAVGAVTAPALGAIARRATDQRHALRPIRDVLGSLAIFSGASDSTLERLASAVQPADCEAGTVLIREGDQPDNLFVAIAGQFTVTIQGSFATTLGPGDWFGEIGLVQRIPRTATVTATTSATVWRIPGDVFVAAIEESGAAPSALVQGIADRLAMSERHRPTPVEADTASST